jgi:hypothetical protein
VDAVSGPGDHHAKNEDAGRDFILWLCVLCVFVVKFFGLRLGFVFSLAVARMGLNVAGVPR